MAAKKKAAKKGTKGNVRKDAPMVRPTGPVVLNAKDRKSRIDSVIAAADKKHGPGAVARAKDVNASYLLRRPTGIISVDIAMAGGWPASAPSVLVGPEGAGKDYLLWRTAAESQRLYGDDFCMATYFTEFKPDKRYMKEQCGFHIAFTEDEIEELDKARVEAGFNSLTAAELDYYRHEIGQFIPIMGISADKGFDEIFNILDANVCQIVAVNSIGFLQTEAKEDTESFEDFAQRSSEASLMSKVMPKLAMYMNRGCSIDGAPNETSLILVNQVRSQDQQKRPMKGMPVQDKDKYKPALASHALKHGKAIELMVHNGSNIWDGDKAYILGRKKSWEILKGKLGTHEGIRGEFNHFYDFGADVIGDLVDTAAKYGVVTVAGSWYSMDENGFKFKTQGAAPLMSLVRKEEDLAEYLRLRCYQEAKIIYRHK
jgi:hypothetical protein